jgi:hypothetical protein
LLELWAVTEILLKAFTKYERVFSWVGKTQKARVNSVGIWVVFFGPSTARPLPAILNLRWYDDKEQSVYDEESYWVLS